MGKMHYPGAYRSHRADCSLAENGALRSLGGSEVGSVLPAGSSGPTGHRYDIHPSAAGHWAQQGWGGHLLGHGRGPQREAVARFKLLFLA